MDYSERAENLRREAAEEALIFDAHSLWKRMELHLPRFTFDLDQGGIVLIAPTPQAHADLSGGTFTKA